MYLFTKNISFFVLSAAIFLLAGCISLPADVAAELEAPTSNQNNHYQAQQKITSDNAN
jgi:starvation-inducible outer membrane lipoprotein